MCLPPLHILAGWASWWLDHAWSAASAIFAATTVWQSFRNGRTARDTNALVADNSPKIEAIQKQTNGGLALAHQTLLDLTQQFK